MMAEISYHMRMPIEVIQNLCNIYHCREVFKAEDGLLSELET